MDVKRYEHGKDFGCSDGGCVFGHPGGMHTNGGCKCLYYDRQNNEARRRATKGVHQLRADKTALATAAQRVIDAETPQEREHAIDDMDELLHPGETGGGR